MPAIPIIGAVTAIAGTASAIDSQRKAANQAKDAAAAAQNSATNGSVDIAALDAQARDLAKKNAADSAALENQYSPGVSALRNNSIAALANGIPTSANTQALADRIAAQAGSAPTGVSYDSPLLRDAIAKARTDLTLGGTLDRDTQNAVARKSLATAGGVGGGLTLGRDITARDLGLTSLQLENQRLQNATTLGEQEAGLGQGNANLSLQAQLAGTNNLFNSANFLNSIDSGDFAKKLALAQFGQNIAQPVSGLDPSSLVNLAIGNSNANARGVQQAAAINQAATGQKSNLASQIAGTGLGIFSKFYNPAPVAAVSNPNTVVNNAGNSSYFLGG